MRTSFHHQPEAQHPNFPLSVSWQADYPIFAPIALNRCAITCGAAGRERCPQGEIIDSGRGAVS